MKTEELRRKYLKGAASEHSKSGRRANEERKEKREKNERTRVDWGEETREGEGWGRATDDRIVARAGTRCDTEGRLIKVEMSARLHLVTCGCGSCEGGWRGLGRW